MLLVPPATCLRKILAPIKMEFRLKLPKRERQQQGLAHQHQIILAMMATYGHPISQPSSYITSSSEEILGCDFNKFLKSLQKWRAALLRESAPRSSFKNLLMGLFLMGCFAGDFQKGKRPIKQFGASREMGH